MIIGLDGSRAFLKYRTGIEEYSYQVIKHLRDTLPNDAQVRVYVRKKFTFEKGKLLCKLPEVDFSFPSNWELRGLWAPRFWTQIRLSLEMALHPPDTLFIPAHTVPVIHPKNTIVVIHGLEYEITPESYSGWERLYMRASIQYSVRAARRIIAVSENTKTDLEKLYKVASEKVTVIHEGFAGKKAEVSGVSRTQKTNTILFIGRIEERKNVKRIVEAFEILKEKYNLPHQLILAGKQGYGYEAIESKIKNSKYKNEIQELGYVTQEQKEKLLSEANLFVFPSLYEGFGLPILEAQHFGVPVVTSNTSSLPEVAGEGAAFVDPLSTEEIAEKLQEVLALSKEGREELIMRGKRNLEGFSWQKCVENIATELS